MCVGGVGSGGIGASKVVVASAENSTEFVEDLEQEFLTGEGRAATFIPSGPAILKSWLRG